MGKFTSYNSGRSAILQTAYVPQTVVRNNQLKGGLMNQGTFKTCMGMLQNLFGAIGDSVFNFYWTRFKHLPDEKFKLATQKVIDTFTPTSTEKFPVPARFLKSIGNDEETRIVQAISELRKAGSKVGVYKSVSFGDRALHAAVMRFGGWPTVAQWTDDEWKFREKQFISAYRSEMNTGTGPGHLMGLAEEDYDNQKCNLSDIQKIAYQKTIKPVNIEWQGFKQIECKQQKVIKQIETGINVDDMFNMPE